MITKNVFKSIIHFILNKKSVEWYKKEPLWSPCRRIYDV